MTEHTSFCKTRRQDKGRVICTDLNLDYKRKRPHGLCIEALEASEKKKLILRMSSMGEDHCVSPRLAEESFVVLRPPLRKQKFST